MYLRAIVAPKPQPYTVSTSILRRSIASEESRASRILVLAIATLLAVVVPTARAADEDLSVNARLLVSARGADRPGIERALQQGAAVDSRNRLGESALIVVLKSNHPDLARPLLDAGANVNQPAINGVTPLMAASHAGQADIVRVLLAKGAAVDAVDRIGKNAMTYAAGEGHTDIVRLLLAHGVDPNAIYKNDLTALMWAAGYGHAETAQALLDAGARPDFVDNRGKSALDIAQESKDAATVALLQRATAAKK
jgi:ankyrin repeat protein